jgi:hypothetical protein
VIDLDNVTRCPLVDKCESCSTSEDLELVTVLTPVGIYCATLCGSCIDHDLIPSPGGLPGAVRRSLEHCGHLGIDADEMGAAIEVGNG